MSEQDQLSSSQTSIFKISINSLFLTSNDAAVAAEEPLLSAVGVIIAVVLLVFEASAFILVVLGFQLFRRIFGFLFFLGSWFCNFDSFENSE